MKPILFNTEMVKAILDGRKTQTRRIIPNGWIQSDKAPIPTHGEDGCIWHFWNFGEKQSKYKVDDILYVRETTWEVDCDCQPPNYCSKTFGYVADNFDFSGVKCYTKTIPSIHMRKYNARIFLKVTNVRVERLYEIGVIDVIKEGCPKDYFDGKIGTKEQVRDWWINLWNSTAKDGYRWEDNPYVFVYEFERVDNGTK